MSDEICKLFGERRQMAPDRKPLTRQRIGRCAKRVLLDETMGVLNANGLENNGRTMAKVRWKQGSGTMGDNF